MFSVIIPTLNRSTVLPFALQSIDKAADGHVVEIIVVDNGSSDGTKAAVQNFAAKNAKVVYQSEPVPGVCRAKNKGISVAAYPILVFTDDDCRMEADYFDVLERLHSTMVEPAIIGGRVELGDPTDAPITIKTDMEAARYGTDAQQFPGGFIHGCNLTMHRGVLDKVGLWDERFGPAGIFRAAEDTEMIYRAHKHGVPILYHPDLVVHHFHGRKTADDVKKLNQSYQFGNGALLGRHADALLLKHFYWNARNWLKEFVGGKPFDADLGLSHGELVKPQIRGAIAYLKTR